MGEHGKLTVPVMETHAHMQIHPHTNAHIQAHVEARGLFRVKAKLGGILRTRPSRATYQHCRKGKKEQDKVNMYSCNRSKGKYGLMKN